MKTKLRFEDCTLGVNVNVTHCGPEDQFDHDFTGHVVGVSGGFVQVRDQDGDVWDCDLDQLELAD